LPINYIVLVLHLEEQIQEILGLDDLLEKTFDGYQHIQNVVEVASIDNLNLGSMIL
jgi:hypothetical protein